MSSHDFKLPKLCPKCKKETEWEKVVAPADLVETLRCELTQMLDFYN